MEIDVRKDKTLWQFGTVYLLFFKHEPKTDFQYFLLMAISKILKQTSTSMSVSYASKKRVTSGHIVMQTFPFTLPGQ